MTIDLIWIFVSAMVVNTSAAPIRSAVPTHHRRLPVSRLHGLRRPAERVIVDAVLGVLALAVLFGLFALSRVAERIRPCSGRQGPDGERCASCPLRAPPGSELGACPGNDTRHRDR